MNEIQRQIKHNNYLDFKKKYGKLILLMIIGIVISTCLTGCVTEQQFRQSYECPVLDIFENESVVTVGGILLGVWLLDFVTGVFGRYVFWILTSIWFIIA